MKRLALAASLLLLLIGCESDFDKCLKANQTKLTNMVTDIEGHEAFEIVERNVAKPDDVIQEWVTRLVPKEDDAFRKALEKQKEAGCYTQGESFEYIGRNPEAICVQLSSDTKKKSDAVMSALMPFAADYIIQESKTSATEICNAQGLYK